jgi:outer membrane protein insertion porin family
MIGLLPTSTKTWRVYKVYNQFADDWIGSASFFIKTVNSLGSEDVRVSERIVLPARKLRGFASGKIGPKDKNEFIGGNYASSLNFSLSLPTLLPELENFDFNLFADAANVWGIDYDSKLDDSGSIRSSTGLSVNVLTPIGPLNFAWALPITKSSTDETENFRFDIGTTF